jgi:hypothetical protein
MLDIMLLVITVLLFVNTAWTGFIMWATLEIRRAVKDLEHREKVSRPQRASAQGTTLMAL